MIAKKTPIISQTLPLRPARRNPRKGFLAATLVVPLLGVVAAFGIAPNTATESIEFRTMVQDLAVQRTEMASAAEEVYAAHERARKGDTVASVLARMNANDPDALTFLQRDPVARVIYQQFAPGREVQTRVSANGELLGLRVRTAQDRVVRVIKVGDEFQSFEDPIELDRQLMFKSGTIKSSLFAATDAAHVPDDIAIQLTKLFATKIDFHQDLREGDRFSLIYEAFFDGADYVKTGRLLAAEFVNQGDLHRLVYFEDEAGRGDHYTPGGKSLRRAFLRSPLEFSRVSSGFSAARLHPVFNVWRAHKGVDFPAPTGTPVLATSDATVSFLGQQNGYGNVIELKHYDRYTTLYAHLWGFARGLRRGAEVKQGEVIGYVGMTGWATGAHLHYEFRSAGAHQDPMGSAVPVAMPLPAELRVKFEHATEPLLAGLNMMRHMASAESFE